jgi:hypothetical protein
VRWDAATPIVGQRPPLARRCRQAASPRHEIGMAKAMDGTATAEKEGAPPGLADCIAGVGWRAAMSTSRSGSTARISGDQNVTSAQEYIVKRLEGLERRIARLEAAAGVGRSAAARASNADAFQTDPRAAQYRPTPQRPAAGADAPTSEPSPAAAGPAASAADAPKTERLDRVPAAGDPFPDLSLLDEKLEPRKGPAEQVHVRAAIEDHPRIANRIQQLWGTAECEEYLTSLVIDTRGNRKGFPPAMLEELLYLGRLARALVILGVDGDLWDSYDQIGDRR